MPLSKYVVRVDGEELLRMAAKEAPDFGEDRPIEDFVRVDEYPLPWQRMDWQARELVPDEDLLLACVDRLRSQRLAALDNSSPEVRAAREAKRAEAWLWLALPATNDAAFPRLAREAQARGITVGEMAEIIIDTSAGAEAQFAAVEAAAMRAKADIRAASTSGDKLAIYHAYEGP